MVYRRFHRPIVWFSALVTAAFSGASTSAETGVAPDAHAQHDGVTLDAYSQNGQITFCFNAEKNVKIASEYGVEFKVPQDQAKLWSERLPKLVAGNEPYFDLPVRIVLKTRGLPHERQISMGLGVCVSATYCTPVSFEITIPATDRAPGASATCTN